jgi:RHS repeat-associated protein
MKGIESYNPKVFPLPEDYYSDRQSFAVIHVYLGSVRLVIRASDCKAMEVNHYDPFGVEYGLSAEPFGIQPFKHQGKERLGIAGFSLHNHGARLADNVMGRWTTRDPLEERDYWNGAYVYCGNNPVKFVDTDGRKVQFAPGTTKEFKQKFARTIAYMNAKGTSGFYNQLVKSKTMYTIKEAEEATKSKFKGGENPTILWDPNYALLTNEGKSLSPATILNHEFDHAADYDKNPEENTKNAQPDETNPYSNKEEQRVIEGSEQATAKAHGDIDEGEVTRKDHNGVVFLPVSDPISNGMTKIRPQDNPLKPNNNKSQSNKWNLYQLIWKLFYQ